MARSQRKTAPNTLHEAVRALYEVFSRYPQPTCLRPDGATNWESHPGQLITKPLRQLSGADLENYVWRAMTTQGSADDFRYFLPRLFELGAERLLPVDLWVVFGKLEYAGWSTWPEEERQAVARFAWALGRREVTVSDQELLGRGTELKQFLESLEQAGIDLGPILEYWWTQLTAPAVSNLAALVVDVYFTNKPQHVRTQLRDWLLAPETRSMLEADVRGSLDGLHRDVILQARQILNTATDQDRSRNASR